MGGDIGKTKRNDIEKFLGPRRSVEFPFITKHTEKIAVFGQATFRRAIFLPRVSIRTQ
jgi:hypothetical protein